MTLDGKRKVIEVLLCGSDYCGPDYCGQIIEHMHEFFDEDLLRRSALILESIITEAGTSYYEYEFDATEAAYRLISSSPQLRREFFGRGAR